MRPPKQAISPSVVRTLKRPSASGLYHGESERPPSPTPLSTSVQLYSNASPFRNWIALTPSVENRQVWRLANPAQNGATLFWSLISIEPGKALFVFRTETGQSLKTRRWRTALLGTGVA